MKVFGCLCYPHLTPYTNHKLQFKSTPSTFLGYSNQHKGCKILLPSGKIIITRHVEFEESIFPYPNKSRTTSSPDSQTPQTPPPLISQSPPPPPTFLLSSDSTPLPQPLVSPHHSVTSPQSPLTSTSSHSTTDTVPLVVQLPNLCDVHPNISDEVFVSD